MRRQLVGIIVVFLVGCGSHPSDPQMLDRFRVNRATFEQLRTMFLEDRGLGRIGDGFTRPDDPASVGVTPERLARYRTYLRDLGLSDGIEGYDRKEIIWFHASTRGLAVSGSSKGYAFCLSPPSLVVPSLDEYHSPNGRSFTAFQHIEGNWYLYYDYED